MTKVFGWLKQLVRGKTLASQILLYFFLAAFVASAVVGSLTYFTARHRIRDQLTGRFSDNASLVTSYIAQTLATAYYDTQLLSYNSVITSPTASPSDKVQEMDKTKWLHGLFEDITLLNSEGVPLVSTDSSVVDWEDTQRVFQKVLAGPPYPSISDVQHMPDPDHMVIIIGAPVFASGLFDQWDVTSVITAQMNMEQIWRFTDSMKIGKTGYVAMVDSSGQYIAHLHKEMLSNYMASKTVSAKEGSLFSYREAEGEAKRTGLLGQTISNPSWVDKGWRVVISQDSNEAFASLKSTLWLILWVLSLAVAFFMVIGILVSRRLSKPLQLLAQGTQRIARGDFSHRVSIRRRDEIGDLSQAYNEMAGKLEQREAEREHLQLLRKSVVLWAGVSGTLSMEKFISGLTKIVLDSFGCDSVWLLLVREQRLESRAFLSRRPEAHRTVENALGRDINQVSFNTQSDINLFTQAFNSRQPIFVEEPSLAAQGVIQCLLGGEPGVVVALPLCVDKECLGVLGIAQAAPFSPEVREIMLALALHSAIAMDNARLYETAQRRSQEKARLYELAGVMSSSLEFREVLERALDGVMSLVPSPETAWAVIASFDEQASTIIYEASKGLPDIKLDGLRVQLDEPSRQELAHVLQGEVIMYQDITLSPEKQRFPHYLAEMIDQIGIRSWLTIPLMVRGRSIGTLRVCNKLPVLPAEEQLEALRNLANNIAIAMDNARLYETAQRQSQEKSRLYELAGVMSSSLAFREVLDRALDGVMSLVPSPETAWTVITKFDEQAAVFTYEASRGAGDIALETLRIQWDEASRKWFAPLFEGKVIMFQDITLLPEKQRFPSFLAETMNQSGMKSWLTMPLMARGRLIGTLRISNKLPLLPSEEQLEALRNLANNIAVAMDNARLYAEERQRSAELKNLEQLKTDFMLAISHELKTPLTSLSVSSGLLQEEVSAAQGTPVYRLLKGIVSSVERLNRLVTDLLEAARLESAAVELNWEFADIVPTVMAATAPLEPLMESKRQQFVMRAPPNSLWARVDLQRLEQIVTNLLSNAHKFTPEGGQIQLVLREEEDNFILEVSNTGPGIPEEEQQRIFEPFYRARGMPRHTGSGLGLTITSRLAKLHGGSITVHSQPGQGATFTVTIPKGAVKQDKTGGR